MLSLLSRLLYGLSVFLLAGAVIAYKLNLFAMVRPAGVPLDHYEIAFYSCMSAACFLLLGRCCEDVQLRRYWKKQGFCTFCGYDLTGKHVRCPECGKMDGFL